MKTGSILDEICAKKALELAAEKRVEDFASIYERAKETQARASFIAALKKSSDATPAVIAELKKASPSSGLIRANFAPADLARSLSESGAAALSVLTEKNFFLGSDENLRIAAATVSIPLLRKDFIFDKYQICQAKVWGASAVLLIAAMLSQREFEDLLGFAKSLGLDALCEAHTEEEIAMLVASGAKIIGVNCRNLKNFHTDFARIGELVKSVPSDCVRVSESAIDSRETLLKAGTFGADAALIGSELMRAKSPAKRLAELLGKAGK